MMTSGAGSSMETMTNIYEHTYKEYYRECHNYFT